MAAIIFTNDEIILGALIENCHMHNVDPKVQFQIINAVINAANNAVVNGAFILNNFIQRILEIRQIFLQRIGRELNLSFIISSLIRVIINSGAINIVPNAAAIVGGNNIAADNILIQMETIHILNSSIFDGVVIALPNYSREVHSLLQSILVEEDIHDEDLQWEENSIIHILSIIWGKIPNVISEEDKIRIICNILYELYTKNRKLNTAIENENAARYNAAVANYALILPNMFPPNTVIPQIGPNATLENYNNWKMQLQRLNPSNTAIGYLNEIKNVVEAKSIFN